MHSGLVKKPGRPATVKKQDVLDLLERHTSDIFHPDSQNLISKTDPIWTTFAREFQNRVLPATIYTYACGFKKGLKSNQNEKDELDDRNLSVHDKTTSIFNNSSLSLDKDIHLQLPLDKNEFMAMTEVYKKICLSRKKGYRMAVRFIPGTYTDKIFDEIVRMTKLCCAFRIDTTHIPLSYDSGYIKGDVLPKVLSPPLIVSNDYNGDSDDEIPIESHRTVQATRETENWRGLEEKSVSKALYYGDRKELLRDAISSKRSHQIDVLKNGNLSSSKLINIKGQSVTVANTCAFDSIAQLLYVSIGDNEALREKITTCHDEFPKFLSNLQKNGIISDTYTRRAEVLLEGRELKNIDNYPAISGLQAASNVVDLASKLTKEFSTIQEIWECSENSCPVIYETRTVRLIRLMDNQIADCNLLEANQNSNLCQGRQRETCSGERKNIISGIGHILLVEVINEDPTKMSKPISVKQLPKSVPSPINDGTTLTLLGAIAYHGPTTISPGRRKRIAHYTAVCLRNHTWYEYDDVYPQRKKSLPDGAKIVPELLIFSKL